MNEALREVLKRLHYPLEIMLPRVRSHVVYPSGLRPIEELMHECSMFVDHTTIHRWTLKIFRDGATDFLPTANATWRQRAAS